MQPVLTPPKKKKLDRCLPVQCQHRFNLIISLDVQQHD
jgi:hypothetical protein